MCYFPSFFRHDDQPFVSWLLLNRMMRCFDVSQLVLFHKSFFGPRRSVSLRSRGALLIPSVIFGPKRELSCRMTVSLMFEKFPVIQ